MGTARLKTWSALSDLGRLPTEYEVVTHRLHYHTEMPFELDPKAPVVAWYKKYRDDISLVARDWNQFRDPRRMVYRKYTENQDDRETFIDVLYEEVEAFSLPLQWVGYLANTLGVLRFFGHGLQMVEAYQAQLAPTSYVTNCLIFEAGDEMRRIQRVAYHLAMLRRQYPQYAWAKEDQTYWETQPVWLSLRELIERLLVTYSWDASWVALNLTVKPLVDRLWLVHGALLARNNEDDLLSEILSNLYLDSMRHQEWSAALARFLIADQPGNREAIRKIIDEWYPVTLAAIHDLNPLFTTEPSQTINFSEALKDIETTLSSINAL